MNTYTSNAPEIIRNDFLKFSGGSFAGTKRRRVRFDSEIPAVEPPFTGSLDELRAEMADDDGRGNFACYKSPIF